MPADKGRGEDVGGRELGGARSGRRGPRVVEPHRRAPDFFESVNRLESGRAQWPHVRTRLSPLQVLEARLPVERTEGTEGSF